MSLRATTVVHLRSSLPTVTFSMLRCSARKQDVTFLTSRCLQINHEAGRDVLNVTISTGQAGLLSTVTFLTSRSASCLLKHYDKDLKETAHTCLLKHNSR